jgi:hypothetical protein
VDIDVDGYDELFPTTLDMDTMEAGDCKTQVVRVNNKGTLPVHLWNWIYTWGDIFNCDPNPNCNMYVKKTLVAESNLDLDDEIDEKIVPTGWEDYELEACLPLCAGNNCQDKTGQMRIFFHAVQQSHLDGYECVKLEDKDAPDWIPDPTTLPHGNVCYKVVPDTDSDGIEDLHIVVNAYGLTADADFQLALDGGDMNDSQDGACTTQDDALAGMVPGDLYSSGYWNWGTFLEATCNATNGGEGVWNYAGVYGGVSSDGSGAISYGATLTGLPQGSYVVKQNVKEVTGALPGTNWTSVLSGLDYLQFTIGP